MKRKPISPETAKTLSTLSVAIIFMVLILSLFSVYTNKTLKEAENDYYENMQFSLDGYNQIVKMQMEEYFQALYQFYVPEYFEKSDKKVIHDFLVKFAFKIHPEFDSIYYIFPDGLGCFSDGLDVMMHKEHHPALLDKRPFYVSDLGIAPGSDHYSFCIEHTIFDDNNEMIGILGASVNLQKFIDQLLRIKIGTKESFMIVDSKGFFMVHKRPDVIGKTYNTPLVKFSNTEYIAHHEQNKIFTIDDKGNEAYLLTKKVKETDWTIMIKIPVSEINEIYKPKKRELYYIILASILIVFFLIFIETKVYDFFQRKQVIATVYDPLTNLWTRLRFESEATKMIKHNSRSKFMLIESDIRGFKFINQNYGEEAADQLILFFSKFISKTAIEYHAIVGRGFADHFYALVKITSVHKAMEVFKSNLEKYSAEIKAYEIPFFPKFGISFLMPGEKSRDMTIQGLIGQASFAKSTIKDNMLTQYSVYNSRLLEKINEEHFIEGHMQQALDAHEFFVMYQPKISLVDEKIVGAEALVRWNSPTLGLLTPDKFIPLFEKNGFITKLDFFVYEEVFKFIKGQLAKGETVLPVSVNMSRNHNKPEKFMHDFLELFNKYGIPANLVQVEILERSVMDSNTLRDITNNLHKEGFTVAMDDFGSGESSLNMLTKIPVDVLKFDREFLNSSTNSNGEIDSKSAKFIHTLIELSKTLEKQTVFEGVETQAQRDFLRSIDCDQAQGYFYSRPLSEQDFVQFIKLHS